MGKQIHSLLKKSGLSMVLLFFLATTIHAQQITVTGTVTSVETGETLPGVNILVQGTTTGTSTDVEGDYELTVPSLNETLVFSYIGYETQEIPIEGRTVINVTMSGEILMDEVIVVGYSERRQSELSSSVSVVSEEVLKQTTQSKDLSTMLQGRVPGLAVSATSGQPDEEVEMRIRGTGSIGAGNEPLMVVDGIIGGTFQPEDVASVTVLKDAAATGLYGSRAANGVIVVTTKKGQKGETTVSYNGSYGPTYHRLGNKRIYTNQERFELFREGYRNIYDDEVEAGNPEFVNQSFDQYVQRYIPDSYRNNYTDWQGLLSRTGYKNRHQLSVSGGSDNTTFYISGTYYDELGTIKNTAYERLGLRANVSYDINDKFTLSGRFNATRANNPEDVAFNGPLFQYYSGADPWDPAFKNFAESGTPVNPRDPTVNWRSTNFVNWFYDKQFQEAETKSMTASTDLVLKGELTDWLGFSSSNRAYFRGSNFSMVLEPSHYLGSSDNGRIESDYSYGNTYTTSNLVTTTHNLEDHNIDLLLGQEYQYTVSNDLSAAGIGVVPGVTALAGTGAPNSVSGGSREVGFFSYFGQFDYNYQGRYTLTGSLRRDASSRFGKDNRWGTFYAVGASWNIGRENFLNDVSWLDLLRLRASYGTTGNADITDYLSLGTISFTQGATYIGNAGSRLSRLPNPNLTWEVAHTVNVGLEMSIIERIQLQIDVYNRENKDLLQGVPLPAHTGFDEQIQNIGSVRNRGIDLNINTTNISTPNFRWESTLNLNFNRNKVLSLANGRDISAGSDSAPQRISEGKPLKYWYMREWAGVDPQTGDPLWIRWEDAEGNQINEGDGLEPANIITTNDYNSASLLYIDSVYPDYSGGLMNQFYYKNFALTAVANFVVGHQIYDSSVFSDGRGTVIFAPPEGETRWREPGDNATMPRIISGGNKNSDRDINSRFLLDGTYLRIQNVTLSYTFPNNVYGFQNLRLSTSMDYVHTFTSFPGEDPDYGQEDPRHSRDAGSRFSPPRALTFGISFDL